MFFCVAEEMMKEKKETREGRARVVNGACLR